MNRYLIVFDLNGTLLDRLSDAQRLRLWRDSYSHMKPSFSSVRVPFFLRPGFVQCFGAQRDIRLKKLLETFPEQTVFGVWTSATERRIAVVLPKVFDARQPSFVWYRDKCVVSETNHKDALKDLTKLWLDPIINSDQEFNATNTILVDDSIIKCREQPLNLLLIPEYSVTQPEASMDTTLIRLSDYFSTMMAQQPENVQDYMKANRFS